MIHLNLDTHMICNFDQLGIKRRSDKTYVSRAVKVAGPVVLLHGAMKD